MDLEDIKGVIGEKTLKQRKQRKRNKVQKQSDVKDCDDIGGMTMSMFGKIDMRELFIIWIAFLFIHTELYSDYFLKRFTCATNEDGTMTMKGTMISSLIMMVVVLICAIVF